MSTSCFLGDIDLVFKILKNTSDSSSGASGQRLFKKIKIVDVQTFEMPKQYFRKRFMICLELFGSHGHVHRVRQTLK